MLENSLSFDRVKKWFDNKVSNGTCVYHGEVIDQLGDKFYYYEIFLWRYFFLHEKGFKVRRSEVEINPFSDLVDYFHDITLEELIFEINNL